ncbi:MAG TPA: DUF1028 domain-containing protein, partial [Gaiellaceae bacterium]|nr:DUF1028 domain-containing protein [Gaiellaceae bacterium]
MTYSIVARDAETGEVGVAVQTGTFGVGRVVQWARPNVGAVATQSFSEKSYGPLGLELMAGGKSAEQALAALLAADPGQAFRQAAMIDASGRAAVHTGSSCVAAAGHHVGEGYSVQANMMASERVWPAMAEAYEAAQGTLARRLLAALDAAEAAGGDFRARQSAALLVVPGEPDALPWAVVSDLRVDDHPEPLAELRRLLELEEAYRLLSSPETATP